MIPTTAVRPVRLPGLGALTDPDALAALLGPIRRVERTPFATTGYSGSAHERIRVAAPDGSETRLVLKRTVLADDWTCRLAGTVRSREVVILDAEDLAGIWTDFACPYVAYAEEHGAAGLLMHDVGEGILPDVREPIATVHEDRLLGSLARMHARFWGREPLPGAVELSGAIGLAAVLGIERYGGSEDDLPPEPIRSAVRTGWEHALKHAPPRVVQRMLVPSAVRARDWEGLPRTLLHGDAKVANFAMLADGRVAAFDWAMAAWGPCALDLGGYLAVNATRLARPKEGTIAFYRTALEGALGAALAAAEWNALEDAAVELGARMLLWSKANALARGAPQARAEWEWWMERLA